MKVLPTSSTAADRLAERLMALLVFANILFFVVFLLSLGTALKANATDVAQSSQQSTCVGENLAEKMKTQDPARYQQILDEGKAVENGDAVMWLVTREGARPSFLLGTMHSADPRVRKLAPEAEAALARADRILIENTEVLDPRKTQEALVKYKEMTLLLDGTTLDQKVPAESVEALQAAVEERNMPWQIARHMQPWMIAAAIAIPVCEVEAKKSGMEVLDTTIGNFALENDKMLVGLETIEEQFRAVASIPAEFHFNALNETLKLGSLSDSVMETTKQLYLSGKIGMLLPLVRAFAPTTYSGKGYAEFQELLIARRNVTMVERAADHLENGNVFMAVGALHLPGTKGIVRLLQDKGYALTPITSM
ncbi:MAG: TraB/GumN family protein [Rhizobiaceae bacterium]